MGRDFGKSRNFSEEVAATIDSEIRRLIDEAYKKAEKLLSENLDKLHAVAKALLEKEKIDAKEFEEVFNNAIQM
jgi:cell division protease FtsH